MLMLDSGRSILTTITRCGLSGFTFDNSVRDLPAPYDKQIYIYIRKYVRLNHHISPSWFVSHA